MFLILVSSDFLTDVYTLLNCILFIFNMCIVRGVPYNITIGAVNEVGQGENVSVVAFSATDSEFIKFHMQPVIFVCSVIFSVPNVTSTNIVAIRSEDGTSLNLTWNPLSLEEAGGFYHNYILLSSEGKKRQTSQITQRVPYSESSSFFDGLKPSISYSLLMRIIVISSDGREDIGPSSETIEIKAETKS